MSTLTEFEGTVLPTFMGVNGQGPVSGYQAAVYQPFLRLGRVIKTHNPTDETNRSKLFFEYDVLVEHNDNLSSQARIVIPRCRMMSFFGGVADFSRFTPRQMEVETKFEDELTEGSQVLVMCVNGNSQEGVIIGGIQHQKAEADNPSDGHHTIMQFNGMRFGIDKDGQLSITFNGKTNAKNAIQGDPLASGTTLTFQKDGSFKVFTKDDGQYFHVDHASKRIDMKAATGWNVTSEGTAKIGAFSDITFTSSSAWCTVNAPAGRISLQSLGVTMGLGTDAHVLGTRYRAAEAVSNAAVIAGSSATASAWTATGIAMDLQAVAFMLLDPSGLTTTATAAAAQAAKVAAGAEAAAALAIGTFETAAPSYLSLKNVLD